MSHLVHTVCHRRGLGGTLARPSAHWLTRSSARIPSRVLSLQLLFQGHDRFELGPAWLQVRGFHGSCKAALGAARPSSETPAPVDPVASDTNKTALQVGFKEKGLDIFAGFRAQILRDHLLEMMTLLLLFQLKKT